jgi:hypothetical protein
MVRRLFYQTKAEVSGIAKKSAAQMPSWFSTSTGDD